MAFISGIVSAEVAALTAEEAPAVPVAEDPKAKKGKARTPSAKKKSDSAKGKGKAKKDEPQQG